jgi:hypothetical protein
MPNLRRVKIDALRGGAIFLMLWGHVIQSSTGDFLSNPVAKLIYTFHMSDMVFLVIPQTVINAPAFYNVYCALLTVIYTIVLLKLSKLLLTTSVGRVLAGKCKLIV